VSQAGAALVPATVSTLAVLVVDDHDFQRNALMHLLHGLGAQCVLGAVDGAQALRIMEEDSVDLVICDLDMPQMDGMECLRHIGMAHPGIAVIIHSAQVASVVDSVAAMAKAYGVKVLGVLSKPLKSDQLEALLVLRPASEVIEPAGVAKSSVEEIRAGVADGQFVPFYQPKVDIASERIVGVEALARWNHPRLGVLGPNTFIETLERTGQIGELTLSLLSGVAQACHGWNERGWNLDASVNLSTVMICNPSVAAQLSRTVAAAGIKPDQITFEVTETVAITNLAPALENLTRLRMRGFGLSVDDFGTGYSSMQQLLRIPFTELKIDQSFVRNCDTIQSSMAAVRSSIDIARALSLKTVAEGVQSRAEFEAVRSAGCDMVQGFYFARPLDLHAFNSFYELNSPS
jgi:EAL domain-containing protein (putative c-di-GMP-specific phosphodiesterase class I)/FixJ family two-component response regulator